MIREQTLNARQGAGLQSEASGEPMKCIGKETLSLDLCFSRSTVESSVEARTRETRDQPQVPRSAVPLKKGVSGRHAQGLSAASAAILSPRGTLRPVPVLSYREDGLLHLQDSVPHGGGGSSRPTRAPREGWCTRPARLSRGTWAPRSNRQRGTPGPARNER